MTSLWPLMDKVRAQIKNRKPLMETDKDIVEILAHWNRKSTNLTKKEMEGEKNLKKRKRSEHAHDASFRDQQTTSAVDPNRHPSYHPSNHPSYHPSYHPPYHPPYHPSHHYTLPPTHAIRSAPVTNKAKEHRKKRMLRRNLDLWEDSDSDNDDDDEMGAGSESVMDDSDDEKSHNEDDFTRSLTQLSSAARGLHEASRRFSRKIAQVLSHQTLTQRAQALTPRKAHKR